MVKFASCDDLGYEKVSGHLWLLVSEAPDAISIRWADQDKIKMGTEKHPVPNTVESLLLSNNNHR